MARLRGPKRPEIPADRAVVIDISSDLDASVDVNTGPATSNDGPLVVETVEPQDLARQLDDLRRSEAATKQQRDAALAEAVRIQAAAEQAKYTSVLNAMGAAQAEADVAQRDFAKAVDAGDSNAMAEAQRAMARAESTIQQLDRGREAMEANAEVAKQQQRRPASANDVIDRMPELMGVERQWLKAHSDAVTDPRQNKRLEAAFLDATGKHGLERGSLEYFAFIEDRLDYGPSDVEHVNGGRPERDARVSAPVSRESYSFDTGRPSNTRVTLSPAERQAARWSGITETEYARAKAVLQGYKQRGHYQDQGG